MSLLLILRYQAQPQEAPPVPLVEDDGSRWAGEWLPLPVPRHLEPAPIPKRKAKMHGKGPTPRQTASMRAIPRCRASAVLIVHDGPMSEIVCRVDMSAVHDEETILAALAAML